MSADLLRQAAALMRERAEDAMSAVGGDHWTWDTGWCESHGTTYDVKGEGPVAAGAFEEIAEYVCPLRPAFSLAVADWLDSAASMGDVSGEPIYDAALTAARTYLGVAS